MRLLGDPSSVSRVARRCLSIWSSREKKVQPLRSKVPNVISWYACGPTVYDDAHIGHASSYVRQDVIRRLVEGTEGRVSVLQLMGVTDIDDKIIAKANKLKVPWESISRKYELEFFEDLEALGVKLPHVKTRVTDYIPQIIQFVEALVSAGLAYPVPDGSVYFNTVKYDGYGKLRKLSEADNDVEEGQGKKNPQDFAVWKGWKPGEPFWETPWGKGRPGWHIECSVMASHYFGSSLDIHSGGMDLIFPHHENEEAQCCARFGVKDWVTHWIHTGHLNMAGDVKMSKSLGNTVTIRKFLETNSADMFRMFCIVSKYRTGLEYSPEALHHSGALLRKFESFISDTSAILKSSKPVCQGEGDLWGSLVQTRKHVFESLRNDFDTPSAIHKISDYVDTFNRTITPLQSGKTGGTVDLSVVLASGELVQNFMKLVGLLSGETDAKSDSSRVEALVGEINRLRGSVRNFALAADVEDKSTRKEKIKERKPLLDACDETRKNLAELGIDVKDHGTQSAMSIKKAHA